MNNVFKLLKLNIKLGKNKSEKSDYISMLFSVLIYGVIISLMLLFFSSLVVNFGNFGAEFYLLVFLLFFVLIVKVAFVTVFCVKAFFNSSQNDILSKLPFTPAEIFISRWIYIFLVQLVFGFALLLPLLNIYGYLLNMSMSFFVAIPFVIILSNIVAMLLGTLLSFPCAYVKTFLSNKFALTLAVITVALAVGFYFYMQVLSSVTIATSALEFNINSEIIEAIARLSTALLPNIYLSNILFFERVIYSILLLTLIVAVLVSIVYILVKKAYEKMLSKNIGEEKIFIGRHTKNKQKKLYSALISREFYSVFRNTGFLFQYFAILIITPLITYLSVRGSVEIVADQIGEILQDTIAFLVLCLFSVVTSNFASNSISREATSFYLFKTTPIMPKHVITSKLIFSAIATFFSLLASVVVLAVAGLISIPTMILILVAGFIFSIGNTSYAMSMDIKRPQLHDDLGISKSDRTSVISIMLGLIVAIFMSIVMLLGVAFDFEVLIATLVVIGMTRYATAGLLSLYSNLEDEFNNIIV